MKPNIRSAVLVGLLVAVIVAISVYYASMQGGTCVSGGGGLANFEATRPARSMPAVRFADGAGAARALADYRGGGVVLNFWATWCGPCIREMPALDRLRAIVGGDGIDVLAVSEDREMGLVEAFYRENGIANLPVLMDEGLEAARQLEVGDLPTTLLIDAEGREVGRALGVAEWDSPGAVALIRGCVGADGAGTEKGKP